MVTLNGAFKSENKFWEVESFFYDLKLHRVGLLFEAFCLAPSM